MKDSAGDFGRREELVRWHGPRHRRKREASYCSQLPKLNSLPFFPENRDFRTATRSRMGAGRYQRRVASRQHQRGGEHESSSRPCVRSRQG